MFFFNLFFISEIEKMKKQMEEEIRAQLIANQADLEGMDWDQKLKEVICASF